MVRDSDLAEIGLFKRKNVGRTQCDSCSIFYNNASVPEYCTSKQCNAYIGGTAVKKLKTSSALFFTTNLASVRIRDTGRPVRTFVNLGDGAAKKVSSLSFAG